MRIVHLSTQLNIQRIVTSISSSKSAMMVGIIVKFSLSYYTFYVIETVDGCTLGDLLSFFTGSSTIPPQGFNKQCTITFNHGSDRLPTASTCSLEIRLPTCHGEDYGSFKDAMVLALKCHDGFGQL